MGLRRRRTGPTTVRAERVEIVDRTGRVRATFGALAGGSVGLTIVDGAGRPAVYVAVDASGPVIALGVGGTVMAEAGVHADGAELERTGPYAFLGGDDGTPLVGIWIDLDTTDRL